MIVDLTAALVVILILVVPLAFSWTLGTVAVWARLMGRQVVVILTAMLPGTSVVLLPAAPIGPLASLLPVALVAESLVAMQSIETSMTAPVGTTALIGTNVQKTKTVTYLKEQ